MFADIPVGLLIITLIIALSSVVIMILQIVYKSRVNILTICKVSVFVPLVAIFIKIANSNSQALVDISKVNDLSESIVMQGMGSMW